MNVTLSAIADNFPTDAGSGGLTFASDDIGGVHYPLTKITFGALDSQTIASSGSGTVDAGVQRVVLATDVALPAGTNAIGKLSANSGVDIGDIDVTSVIPGTGATNLGKALDTVAGAADVGVAAFGVHEAEAVKVEIADGDWGHLHLGELGGLSVEPEQHNHLDDFNVTTGWAALGNDTLNLATTKKHVTGTDALTFDKVNGAANTIFAGIEKTITSVDIGDLDLHDLIQVATYLPSIGAVAYVFIRIGTDSSNYNEWRVGVSELTAAEFLVLAEPVGNANNAGITGNGWTTAAITYIAVGVAFDAETDTLAGIIFDQLGLFTNSHATTQTIEISSTAATGNVNVQKVGGSPTDKGSGNASNGSQRIVIATDDVNQSAIKTAVEIIDNAVHVDDAGFTLGTDSGVMMMGFAGTQSVDANDAGAIAIEADGSIHCALDAETTKVIGSTITAAAATGGMSFDKLALAAEDNDKVIKGSAGTLYFISVQSIDATPVFLKLFDATSITPGTTSADMQFMCPANTTAANGAGIVLNFSPGIQFATGIVALISTGIALDDNTAVSANEVIVTLGFE